MDKFQKILLQYWGHTHFRPLQEEIITSIYQGNDTLALMPTGGGKSITFQIPALAKEGICIVITPLIALMKDQVEGLRAKNIKALMIHSGMTSKEIDVALDNAIFGDFKFLYLSPERLQTELFKTRLRRMNVNLLAVDEAHCISQWGYDFRPPYLEIAALRPLIPNVPILAVTATATPKVADDIMDKLAFTRKNLLQKSFERKNIIYLVRHTEDKLGYLLRILRKMPYCGIVYVRSRKKTKEIADFLLNENITADFYHAGLSADLRNLKQEQWMKGQTQVIVATNAFGMGIDKPDVRTVVHLDLPDSIEAYFQEAGRAGRDENKAFAVLLYNDEDKTKIDTRVRTEFPEIELIKRVYQAVGNYLQIPYGAGKGAVYDFNLSEFSVKYKFYPTTVISAFRFLLHENLAQLTEDIESSSRVYFIVDRHALYKIQINSPESDRVIKALLRTYTGLFNNYVAIDEELLARLIHLSHNEIYQILVHLSKLKVISYIPRKRSPLCIMHEERLDDKNINISTQNYKVIKDRYTDRIFAILKYVNDSDTCRSEQLLGYFGETAERCGNCDVCKQLNKLNMDKLVFQQLLAELKDVLTQPTAFDEIVDQVSNPEKTTHLIRWLIDDNKITLSDGLIIDWKK